MMTLNRNETRRDAIIGDKFESNHYGGIKRFDGLTHRQIELLFAEGFVDPEERQNEAPNTETIRDFIAKYPEHATIIGYTVGIERSDYRVTFEGVELKGELTLQMCEDFHHQFGDADEYICDYEIGGYARCWYD